MKRERVRAKREKRERNQQKRDAAAAARSEQPTGEPADPQPEDSTVGAPD